jgi:hypothetical protein
MATLGEIFGMDPQIGQPSCYESGREPFFSEVVALSNTVDDFMKGCYAWTMWDTYGWGPYANQAWDACGVLVWFPL